MNILRFAFYTFFLLVLSIPGLSQSSTDNSRFKIKSLGLSYIHLDPAYLAFNVEYNLFNLPVDIYSTLGYKINRDPVDDSKNVGVSAGLGPSFRINDRMTLFSALGVLIRATPNSDPLATTNDQEVYFYSEVGSSLDITKWFGIQGGLALTGRDEIDLGLSLGFRIRLEK